MIKKEKIFEKFQNLNCPIEEMTLEDISKDFREKIGEILYEQMFLYPRVNKFIWINISNLNPTKCSYTLYNDIYKQYFNLKENSGNIYTHWRLLNTSSFIIELANDKELGTIYYINKGRININWYGYILIFDYED